MKIKNIIYAFFAAFIFFNLYNLAYAAYTKTFTISAYYSPIPGQTRYITGSYEGDIKLNGSGVNSADGTPVYPGMVAAPSAYPFGTKMNIPGIGTVAVHDRGGAIVHAGERGNAYDRLDVWMGYGDEGLTRALNWGKRTVQVTVYGIEPNIKENVYLKGYSEAERFIKNIIVKQKIFKSDLWYGVSSDKVGELQTYLSELGYYKGKIDKYYGDALYKAVIAFQLDQGIIDNEEEFGAGYFGPRTRAKIEAVLDKRRKNEIPTKNLGKNDKGKNVKKLQKALKKLGYDIEITGIYDEKTIKAVFKFQKDHNILEYEDEFGAGYFGPRTFAVLSQKLANFKSPELNEIKQTAIVQADYNAFVADLHPGDTGNEVKRLQEVLYKMNLIRINPTGYYGEITKNAVFKFQQKKGILTSKKDSGAGIFGPKTRNAVNNLLGLKANTKAMIASKTASFKENKIVIAETSLNTFTQDLSFGSKGEEVELLQKKLKSLGFYKGGIITDYFGNVTKEALIAFQIDQGIIKSPTDAKAGVFDAKTRKILNSII
jgi:peptidoglycan hydrolase-like protein with peptidoglycan-binding domain